MKQNENRTTLPLEMRVNRLDTQGGSCLAHLSMTLGDCFAVRGIRLMEGKNECPEHVVWNHRIYRVYGGLTRPTPDTPATIATTYRRHHAAATTALGNRHRHRYRHMERE